MLALALAVTAIALPDSLNPTLIVAAVYITTGPHPVRGAIAFTLAAFAVTLAGGLAIALGLADVVVSLVPKPSATLKWSILTVVGVLLVCGGAVIWWRRASLADSEPPSQREHTSHGPAMLMGAGIAGVELLSAFPYFAAIAMVAGSSVSFAGKVFLLVLYDMIYVLPLIAIVVVRVVMGERGTRVLAPIGDWIAMRWPVIAAPMAAVVGIALTAYGIVRLA